MDKLIKAKKAALGVLFTGLIIAVVGVLGSALAIKFGQAASGYAVIVLIPIGVFGLIYGLFMLRKIDNCLKIVSDINSGKQSIEELCAVKTESAKVNARKLINNCIEEGFLEGYELDESGSLICKSEDCKADGVDIEREDKPAEEDAGEESTAKVEEAAEADKEAQGN